MTERPLSEMYVEYRAALERLFEATEHLRRVAPPVEPPGDGRAPFMSDEQQQAELACAEAWRDYLPKRAAYWAAANVAES
jgi:hypothetical protein